MMGELKSYCCWKSVKTNKGRMGEVGDDEQGEEEAEMF